MALDPLGRETRSQMIIAAVVVVFACHARREHGVTRERGGTCGAGARAGLRSRLSRRLSDRGSASLWHLGKCACAVIVSVKWLHNRQSGDR